MNEIILEPLVFCSWHCVQLCLHFFLGLDAILLLPGTVPLLLSSILVGFQILHVENVVDTISLNFILDILGQVHRHFDVVHQSCDSALWSVPEAAEADSSGDVVEVAHLIVERNVDVWRFSSTDVEDAFTKVVPRVGSRLVVVSCLDKEPSPLGEFFWLFDSRIF